MYSVASQRSLVKQNSPASPLKSYISFKTILCKHTAKYGLFTKKIASFPLNFTLLVPATLIKTNSFLFYHLSSPFSENSTVCALKFPSFYISFCLQKLTIFRFFFASDFYILNIAIY